METIELIKAGWPIVLGLIGLALFVGDSRTTLKEVRSSFENFKDKQYEKDRIETHDYIKSVQASHSEFERKIEAKLDQMMSKSDAQLEKVYEKVNEMTKSLAEVKGRLYSDRKEPTI